MNRTPGKYEARGTFVVTPPQSELFEADKRGESLTSTRICDCAGVEVLPRARLLEAEANARFIAHACNCHDALLAALRGLFYGDDEHDTENAAEDAIMLAEGSG